MNRKVSLIILTGLLIFSINIIAQQNTTQIAPGLKQIDSLTIRGEKNLF